MILIGDIGNTDIKIALFNDISKKLILKIRFRSKLFNSNNINIHFKKIKKYFSKIDKILFCSVVPKKFQKIKNYFENVTGKKCYELKKLKIEKLINIKVDKNQIGSDRLANSISV